MTTRPGSGGEDARGFVARAFTEFQGDVHGFAVHATRDGDAAEDVTQEAFVRLLAQVEAHGPPANTRAWLLRVATNLVISGHRRRSVADRWQRWIARDEATSDSPEATYLRQEHHQWVHEALGSVAPDARVALLLAASGFSGREIAAAIGRSELATRTLVCRAKAELRDRLSGHEELRQGP
ncbi:MAG: RNA polymerase sigma factor [Chloroflexi bacterium]|nr:RNA polymerase sigma factor [Chloroflexota bacterium]